LNDHHRHRLRQEVDRGEHSDHAVDRSRYLDLLPEVGVRDDLRGPDSVRFNSSRQLVELGTLKASADFAQVSGQDAP
jgi:hypothetical protein